MSSITKPFRFRVGSLALLTSLVAWTSTGPASADAGSANPGSGIQPAATYTVDRFDDVAEASECDDRTPADCSLRGALRRANLDGRASRILLPGGHYRLTIEGPEEDAGATGDLDHGEGDLLIEPVDRGHPIIEQLAEDRILDIHRTAGHIVLRGPMTFRGGRAPNLYYPKPGGSMRFLGAPSLSATRVRFEGGSSQSVGGCLSWETARTEGFLLLEDVQFVGCRAEWGAGGLSLGAYGGPITLRRVEVLRNSAGWYAAGGSIAGDAAPVLIEDSTFLGNRVADALFGQSVGGGLHLGLGNFTILGTTIADNQVGLPDATFSKGGGLWLSNSNVTLRNSTITGNRALGADPGGADLAGLASMVRLEFVTLQSLDLDTAALELDRTRLETVGSILEAACGGVSPTFVSEGHNLIRVTPGSSGPPCGLSHPADRSTEAPILRPLAGNGGPTPTHRLRADLLPAPNTVPIALCPETDQRGAPRLGPTCHRGAVEDGSPAPGPQLFADGFESATPDAWAAVVPSPP